MPHSRQVKQHLQLTRIVKFGVWSRGLLVPCFVVGSHKLCHKYGVLAPDMLLVKLKTSVKIIEETMGTWHKEGLEE